MKLRQRLQLNRICAGVLLLGVVIGASVVPFMPKQAAAVSPADWRPGHIIDDSIFYNKDAMTVGQIQEFLNAKVPSCNRWHSSGNADNQPPFTCLKEYLENPGTRENNVGRFYGDGSPLWISGGQSAAQIIWNAAQSYNINPQVLIVMLQKEQGLVTDNWPWRVQYQRAMGYACPDTAPCDERYFGFFNQVDNAAWQLRQYGLTPGSFLYRSGATRTINYNPDASCGGSSVYIENQATAALYNYTPYQPNQGALNAGYGTAACGAYGNRNFWLYFNEWFGSTNAGDNQVQIVEGLSISPSSSLLANETVRPRFTVRNQTGNTMYVGGLAVAVRRTSDNANFDYGLRNVTLPPWGSYTYSESQLLPAGTYSFEVASYRPGVGWTDTYPTRLHNGLPRKIASATVQPAVQISSGLSLNTNAVVPGKTVTASFQISNPNASPVNVGLMAVTARDAQGRNVDFAPDMTVTVPANGTYTYSKSRTFDNLGTYTLNIANYREGIGWNAIGPPSASSAIVRTVNPVVKPNPRITSGLTITPANPIAGQNVTASFQVRNDSDSPVNIGTLAVAARDAQGRNADFAPELNVTIPANSTYTYSKTKAFMSGGSHTFSIANHTASTGWRVFPHFDAGTGDRRVVNVGANPTVVSSLSVTPANPIAGQNVTASFQVRNDGDVPMDVGVVAVAARGPQGQNVDFAPDVDVTIQPNTTYTYSKTKAFMTSGAYSFAIANHQESLGWNATHPISSSSSIVRSASKTLGANPTVTTGLSLSPSSPAAGQPATASFVVTNNGDVPMSVGDLAVAVRGPAGQNFDYARESAITIGAHSTFTYSKQQAFPGAGSYTFSIANFQDSLGWNATHPVNATPSLLRTVTAAVKPNPRVITGLSLTPSNPVVGQNVTASFQIRNDSASAVNVGTMAVAARGPQGQNVDIAPDINLTIPANTTYTYSRSQSFASPGQYTFQIANFRSDLGWNAVYPMPDNGGIVTLLKSVVN